MVTLSSQKMFVTNLPYKFGDVPASHVRFPKGISHGATSSISGWISMVFLASIAISSMKIPSKSHNPKIPWDLKTLWNPMTRHALLVSTHISVTSDTQGLGGSARHLGKEQLVPQAAILRRVLIYFFLLSVISKASNLQKKYAYIYICIYICI